MARIAIQTKYSFKYTLNLWTTIIEELQILPQSLTILQMKIQHSKKVNAKKQSYSVATSCVLVFPSSIHSTETVDLARLPLEVICAANGDTVVEYPHGLHHLFLDFSFAHDFKVGQKMICYRDQSIFRPAAEPVHCATTDKTWKFQGPVTEFLTNLWRKIIPQSNKICRDQWFLLCTLCASSFLCVFMDGEEAEAIKTQKRTWPVSSHLDWTRLVNKWFITLSKDYTKEFHFWGNKAGNPERVADQTQDSLNLARSRSQPYNKFS